MDALNNRSPACRACHKTQVCDVLAPGGELVVLIKPQFEAGKEQVGGCRVERWCVGY